MFEDNYLPPLRVGEWDGTDFAWEQFLIKHKMAEGRTENSLLHAKHVAEEIGLIQDRERQVPFHYSLAESTHMSRYLFASRVASVAFAGGIDHTLDYGCGSGYGLKVLEQIAQNLIGIDSCVKAIEYANQVNGSPKSQYYSNKNWTVVPSVNFITCFEMIEHVSESEGQSILKRLHEKLTEDGLMVISTPRRPYGNPFHIHEYNQDEFRNALEIAGFYVAGMFGQCNTTIEPIDRLSEQYEQRDKFTMIAICCRRKDRLTIGSNGFFA